MRVSIKDSLCSKVGCLQKLGGAVVASPYKKEVLQCLKYIGGVLVVGNIRDKDVWERVLQG